MNKSIINQLIQDKELFEALNLTRTYQAEEEEMID